jgi:hypothetical protein
MITTTREQRVAIKRVFDRQPIYTSKIAEAMKQPISYKRFRKSVMGTIAMDGAIVVNWAGMWLVIEVDGYTHS